MKHLTLTRALGCALFALPMAAAFSAGDTDKLHLQLARQLVDDLRDQTIKGQLTNGAGKALNSYATTEGDSYIRLKQDGNTYSENYSKCSSFVNRMLERAYGWNWKALGATTNSPNAAQTAQLIRTGIGLYRVNNFLTVRPGDIMAIDYLGDPSTDATGHVTIIQKVLWDQPANYLGEKV